MTEEDQKYYGWQEGMPTKPDVDMLIKTWPDPDTGFKFEYETVSNLIGINLKSARFKTVTNAWRTAMRNKGYIIECISGEAFYVASADDVTTGTYGAIQGAARKLKKHKTKLARVKTENEGQRKLIAHQGRLLHELERSAKKTRFNLLPDTSSAGPPAITGPIEKMTKE